MTKWRLIRDGDLLILRDCDGGGGNYMRKMQKLVKGRPEFRGKLSIVDIYHEDWCAALKGEGCNCDPDLEMRR